MLFLAVPPVLAAPAATPDKALGQLLEALEAIPESLTDRKAAQVPKAKADALKVWDLQRASLEPALKPFERKEVIAAFDRMKTSEGVLAAEAALDASEGLAKLEKPGRAARLGAVDRFCQRAWLRVEMGRWSDLPDLPAAFQPFLDHDGSTHPKAVKATRLNLDIWSKAMATRDKAQAQVAAERLLECVDRFEVQ